MKKISILLSIVILGLLLTSCDKDKLNISTLKGKAQKGPFVTGTSITLNELNSDLVQKGKSFTTTIVTNDGSFNLNNIKLNSNLALLTANGYYFSEIYGELSSAPLSLQAITDLSSNESVNINVLTHLIKGRIENLVSTGMSFEDANTQAKSEFLAFLGITNSFNVDFEELDISSNEDYNAALLSFSVILQRYTKFLNQKPTLTAELTQLLADISADFATDGLISNTQIIDTLLHNISQLHLIDARKHIEKRYSDLGQNVVIPNFEKYIAVFQEKHCSNIYTDFTYPLTASPDPTIAPDSETPNILVPSDTVFTGNAYTVAAITPLYKTLKIKFIGSNVSIGGIDTGWEIINEYPNGFTVNSQRQNALMSMLIHLEYSGSATIEYYEDNSETPTFVKNITWESVE